ncbi:MAG: hypothetical protein ACOCX7_05170 [Bacteroidota bacterium]
MFGRIILYIAAIFIFTSFSNAQIHQSGLFTVSVPDVGAGYSFQKFSDTRGDFDEIAKPALETSINAEYFLARQFFVNLRAGYSIQNSETRLSEEFTYLKNGVLMTGQFRYEYELELRSLHIYPGVGIKDGHFSIMAGFGYNLVGGTHEKYRERLTEPEDAVFEGGGRIRNETEGEVADMKDSYISFWAGASYDFPLNRRESIYLTPSLRYDFSSVSVNQTADWKYQKLIIGIAAKFNFSRLFD